jgi:flagellar biosynthesis protein FliR
MLEHYLDVIFFTFNFLHLIISGFIESYNFTDFD